MTDIGASAVVDFWFGDSLETPPDQLDPHFRRWFMSDGAIDAEIYDRFGAWVERGASGEFDDWRARANGGLALIILLDQFPRNIWRGQARAFAYDSLALERSRYLIASGQDRELHPLQRIFAYMPHQHAEDLAVQDASIDVYGRLLEDAADPYRDRMAGVLDYAREHREIIRQFGRFPHRNAVLGRTSTPEEEEYLAGGGKRFGQ